MFELPVPWEVIRNLTPNPSPQAERGVNPLPRNQTDPRNQAEPGNEKKEPLALESGYEKKQAEPAKPRYQAQPGNEKNEKNEPLAVLTSLSLLESATTHPHEPKTYRVPAILAPLLQPLLTEEEWHTTRVQAVKTIYKH